MLLRQYPKGWMKCPTFRGENGLLVSMMFSVTRLLLYVFVRFEPRKWREYRVPHFFFQMRQLAFLQLS